MRYAPKSLEGEFSEAHITKASYVECRRSIARVHKTLIIPDRIVAPHRLGPRAEVMGQSELRHNGVLRSSWFRRRDCRQAAVLAGGTL
jgi:hypothetical protein